MQIVKTGSLIVIDCPLQGFLSPLLLLVVREVPPEFPRDLGIIIHLGSLSIIGLNLILGRNHEYKERREGLLLALRPVLITFLL